MNPRSGFNLDELLDAYLDGTLDAQSAADAERRLLAEPEYARQVELQRGIDASMRRRFVPPGPQRGRALLAAAEQAATRHLKLPRRRSWVYAAAAAILLIGLSGVWYVWQQGLSGAIAPLEAPITVLYSFGDAYSSALRSGWKPDFVCDNEQEFAGITWKRSGQAMLLPATAPGLSVVGWTKLKTLSKNALMLLVQHDEQPIAVFLDKSVNDEPQPPTLPGGLHVFRREFGEAVLYEVSPLDAPRVLDQFYDPLRSIEWYIEGAENAW